jgi:hypothetical protein
MTAKEAIDNVINQETRAAYAALADGAMRFVAELADAIAKACALSEPDFIYISGCKRLHAHVQAQPALVAGLD